MKITILNASMKHHGINNFIKIAHDIFKELETNTVEQNLNEIRLPYYDGDTVPIIDKIMEEINSSDGVIITFPVYMKAPCSLLQCFLEYLELEEYRKIFKGKHIMLVAVSMQGGELSALSYLSSIVYEMGGFARFQLVLTDESDDRTIIEKELEDFYRSVRQNRVYLMPSENFQKSATKKTSLTSKHEKDIDELLYLFEKKHTPKQEKDIDELSTLFEKKHIKTPRVKTAPKKEISILTPEDDDLESIIYEDYSKEPEEHFVELVETTTKQKINTTKQATMSMPHHFEPHLSRGLSAVYQFNILGVEGFDGYITIQNTDCYYTDGIAKDPDITITSDSKIWLDILNKKLTAQKAFMIGGIKVRGDFVLLTRFDSLFKL